MITSRFLLLHALILVVVQVKSNDEPKTEPIRYLPEFHFVCDVKCKREEMIELPPYCTALANSNVTLTSMMDVKPLLKPKMKFMHTINDIKYEDWGAIMINDVKIDEIAKEIVDMNINAIAFDKMYLDGDKPFEIVFSSLICPFIKKIKKKAKGVLVGLWVRHHWVQSAFDLQAIDEDVDFYILKSFDYHGCKKNIFGKNDHRTTQEKDLEDSIGGLTVGQFNFSKVLLTIDIVVYTFHVKFSIDSDDYSVPMTHLEVCRDKKSKHRLFCIDNLEQYFNKAKLAYSNSMMGIYVMFADYDDYTGYCECEGPYPVLKELDMGLRGEGSGGELMRCPTFGKHKK